MALFKDYFSRQSAVYAKYRPSYPEALFIYLSSLTAEHDLAWDCATGNGQCALSLANYYKSVYATDASEQQIKNAVQTSNIIYKVENAEHSALNDNTVDLITVAQAVHWFDFDKFYAEVKRVLKPNGVIAVWAYGLPVISPEIDNMMKHFHAEIVGEFWQDENRLIDLEYSTIPFPFKMIEPPEFKIGKALSLDDFIGHVNSWSAVQKFIDRYGTNPVNNLNNELATFWPDEEKKEATWKLILKIGRNISS